ncbi:MAG: hypothetical protein ACI9P5_002855 [Saprospiraceae bacterium]|jgi:hypothetical protein
MTKDITYYSELQTHSIGLSALFSNESHFTNVPRGWHIIVVDVENSTQAVKNELHHNVNLSATGAIIAVLNHIKSLDSELEVPYFFGGDGASFIVPPSIVDSCMEILEDYRFHVRNNLYLSLKMGSVTIAELYDEGHILKISKLQINESLTIPILLGEGLKIAERRVKGVFIDETVSPIKQRISVNLTGMECRWQEIDPPQDNNKIICLLVNSVNEKDQAIIYKAVIDSIDKIFGDYTQCHPISIFKLKLDLKFRKIRNEMFARIGKYDISYLAKNWLITIMGKYYFTFFKSGKEYLNKVSQLSYTTMVDGTINCVITGSESNVVQLRKELDKMEGKGNLIYGIHVTHAAVLSCYVEDRIDKHIHFVDGTEGGFTSAAKVLKLKFA